MAIFTKYPEQDENLGAIFVVIITNQAQCNAWYHFGLLCKKSCSTPQEARAIP